ncbi:hypothetical protein V8F06_006744 [Rhypophila decipiens]
MAHLLVCVGRVEAHQGSGRASPPQLKTSSCPKCNHWEGVGAERLDMDMDLCKVSADQQTVGRSFTRLADGVGHCPCCCLMPWISILCFCVPVRVFPTFPSIFIVPSILKASSTNPQSRSGPHQQHKVRQIIEARSPFQAREAACGLPCLLATCCRDRAFLNRAVPWRRNISAATHKFVSSWPIIFPLSQEGIADPCKASQSLSHLVIPGAAGDIQVAHVWSGILCKLYAWAGRTTCHCQVGPSCRRSRLLGTISKSDRTERSNPNGLKLNNKKETHMLVPARVSFTRLHSTH